MPRGRIKSRQLVVGTIAQMVKGDAPLNADLKADLDRQSILWTLEEYTRAWFSGDAAAMDRCLHPELTARLLQLGSEVSDGGGIYTLPRSQGIQAMLGACTHPMERHSEINILDITGHSASARAVLGDWTAYMHLSFTGEKWAIVNVLWEWLSSRDRRSA